MEFLSPVQALGSRDPHRQRLKQLQDSMNLDAIVLNSFQAVSYFARTQILTQILLPDRLAVFIQVKNQGDSLVVCNLERTMVDDQTDLADVHEYVEFEEQPAGVVLEVLRAALPADPVIGYESRRMPADTFRTLAEALPSATFVSVDDAVENLQSRKTPQEIETLGRAGVATVAAIQAAVDAGFSQMSERDFAAEVVRHLVRVGAGVDFLFFGAGVTALQGHPEPRGIPMPEGTIWRIDCGGRFDGVFKSDVARTGVVGEASARQQRTLKALRGIQQSGIDVVKAGVPARVVFETIREQFAREGLPFFMPHIGHGIGIGLHEAPILEPGNDTVLETGSVLCIEPMVRLFDEGECYHVEDLVLVTDSGFELLTQPQEALLEIPA